MLLPGGAWGPADHDPESGREVEDLSELLHAACRVEWRLSGARGMRRPLAILFDVGDTLLQEVRFDLTAGIRAALPGRDHTRAAHLARVFRSALREAHADNRELLLSTWLIGQVPELHDKADEWVEDAIWPEVVTLLPYDGANALLDWLRCDGVVIGAISNAYFSSRVLRRELERHDLEIGFQLVLSSGDLGIRKPDARIYAMALGRLNVAADRAWFVGDTFEEDVEGALVAGLVPIWLRADGANHDIALPVRHVQNWRELASMYLATESGA